jgi:hypothetical protein
MGLTRSAHQGVFLSIASKGSGCTLPFLVKVGLVDYELRKAGLDPAAAVQLEMEPRDLVLWTLYTVHGSGPNTSVRDERILMINSYMRAADSPSRGEWAFRIGCSAFVRDRFSRRRRRRSCWPSLRIRRLILRAMGDSSWSRPWKGARFPGL